MSSHTELFSRIHDMNVWGSGESRSGPGSTMWETKCIIPKLGYLFEELDIKSILDVPCGDYNWIQAVKFPKGCKYTGGDVVEHMIAANNQKFGKENVEFRVLNICTDEIPKSDLILCRDCLFHLSFDDGNKAIQNFKNSGSTYLLTTTFPSSTRNDPNSYVGGARGLYGWQHLNLQLEPYNLPEPLKLIDESHDDLRFKTSKFLALWRLSDL